MGVEYTTCNPSNSNQQGGGYGFTNESVQDAGLFRGLILNIVNINKTINGGKRRCRKSMKKEKNMRKKRKSQNDL